MKVVVVSSKPFNHTYFDAFSDERHQIVYLEPHLNEQTVAPMRSAASSMTPYRPKYYSN